MTIAPDVAAARSMEFSVRRAGARGEPVMLLRGFPEYSAMWALVMTALAGEGYQTVAPDQRGYSPGATPSDIEAYRHGELVSDIFAMADALGCDRFHLAEIVAPVIGPLRRHPIMVRPDPTVAGEKE